MDTSTPEPEVVELRPATTAVVAGVVPVGELTSFFDRSFGTLAAALGRQGVAITGPAFARYHGPPEATADLEVGFPVDATVEEDGEVRAGSLPGGRVARSVHRGGYDGLGGAWDDLQGWIADHGYTAAADLWEVYVTEPSPDMDPADLRTELYWLLS